jgi:hypothetical protein
MSKGQRGNKEVKKPKKAAPLVLPAAVLTAVAALPAATHERPKKKP